MHVAPLKVGDCGLQSTFTTEGSLRAVRVASNAKADPFGTTEAVSVPLKGVRPVIEGAPSVSATPVNEVVEVAVLGTTTVTLAVPPERSDA
jgi:hypothetical protein